MKTSRFALAAVATALMGTSAMAADLGGNCCADLEERIAELEATTVRKGNRKVSLQISGFVSHHVMWWDDGSQSDMYIGDGGNGGSRFRFRGEAKINPELTAGFLYEFGVTNNSISSMNQLNGGDDLGTNGLAVRDTTVWLRHKRLGMVKIGHGSTATDNLVLIDLGGMGMAGTPDTALYVGGMILRSNAGLLGNATSMNWAAAIRGHDSWDTTRRNHVLYETPTLHGFTVQAAVAEDNYWDVALRYAGEFNGIRVAFGIGYQVDTEFNGGSQIGFGTTGDLCATRCDVKSTELKGALSVLHVPTGLFFTGSAGTRELEGTHGAVGTTYSGPDLSYWAIAGGLSRNFFGVGKTVLFGEYSQSEGGLEQATFLGTQTGSYTLNVAGARTTSEVTGWGIGVNQYIDAAAMEIYAAYKVFSLEATGFTGANATLNVGQSGVSDISVFLVGTKINF
jgi:hypothetical protein